MATTAAINASIGQAPPRTRKFPFIVVALLLPMVIINLIAFVIPVIRLGMISFLESRGGVLTNTLTLENYANFIRDSYSFQLIYNSLVLGFGVTIITLILSYPIALFLHRVSSKWRNLLFVITVSPLLVSSVVRTYGWMVILGDQGLVNGILMSSWIISTPIRLTNNMLGVFIGMVEVLIPYMTLSLIAGFGRLDVVFEEAAASLGANSWVRFRRVILPLTMPGIALGCLLCFVLSISSFITPKLLGGGRVFLLATEIYDQAIVQLAWPTAAAISVVVLIIFGLALAIYSRVIRRFD
ncbi:ABC transporter permease [Microvirga sp. VF16]|uniref:ABC transporter permease n=1 Tax=Microvirga sp. VF16 TaxID=2807101 RepID=UPI00193EA603|nr:ABC transporter permease [Microvirga sp. VF16]QRM32672.1 ABC transporter permease [Microvirga sp. VF16]